MCGKAPKKPAILKQLQTHFKGKREKCLGTPFPRVPVPVYSCFLVCVEDSVLGITLRRNFE